MQCVILAGGNGTRMRPRTSSIPKVLLPVRGEPFAHWQLGWLSDSGVDSVLYCIGYLGDAVRDFVGDGSRWSLSASYSAEGAQLLGTAGALRLAYDRGLLQERFLVIYGDSWLDADPADVMTALREADTLGVMTVYRNEDWLGDSNAVVAGGRVVQYAKGLATRPREMRWIDYGLMAFHRGAIANEIPPKVAADLAQLQGDLAARGQLASYEVTNRFYEIGSPHGYEELCRHLTLTRSR